MVEPDARSSLHRSPSRRAKSFDHATEASGKVSPSQIIDGFDEVRSQAAFVSLPEYLVKGDADKRVLFDADTATDS